MNFYNDSTVEFLNDFALRYHFILVSVDSTYSWVPKFPYLQSFITLPLIIINFIKIRITGNKKIKKPRICQLN